MSTLQRTMAIAAILTVLALPAAAQQPAPGPGPRDEQSSEQKREEIRKKMEAIRIARMTEELKLDEKTAAKFIPVITSLDQRRRTLLMENQQILQEMRILLNAPQTDEARLKTAISSIEKNQHEVQSLRSKELSAVKDHLNLQQQAKYLLFHAEFQREMRGMIEGARSGPGRGNARGVRPGREPMRGAPQPGM